MDLVWFFAFNGYLLSDKSEVVRSLGPHPPANIGYLAIFWCLIVLVLVCLDFFVRHPGGKKPTVLVGLLYVGLVVGCFVGAGIGYESHVEFLRNWYATR